MTQTWLSARWISCALFALGLTACGSCTGSGAAPTVANPAEAALETEEDAIAVRTAVLSLDTLSELYATTATLRADKLATVTARTEGVVRRLLAGGAHADAGDRLHHVDLQCGHARL